MKPKPLSKEFLLSRGFCCHCGCKNCPYTELQKIKKETKKSS